MDLSIPTPTLPTPPAIALGTFSGGAKDDVATADIYKVTSSVGDTKAVKPITSIQELSAAIDKSTMDLTLDSGAASDFMSKVNGEVAFDQATLTSRLLGISSEFRSAVGELNEKLKLGSLNSIHKDQASKLMCTVNDVTSMVDSSNIKDVQSLGQFINKYTGSKVFSGKDRGAISGLLGSVITKASDLGIPNVFKTITSTITDNGIIGRVTRAVLPIAIRNGDTGLLKEITSGPTAGLVNVFSPGFSQNFSRAFSYRGNRADSLKTFEDVFSSFENMDSQWDVLQRGGGDPALNLLALMGGSRDFQNLTMAGVGYWITEQENGKPTPVKIDPLYALASAFQEVTVGAAIKRDFPQVALLNAYDARMPTRSGLPGGMRSQNNNTLMDPRIINGALGALFGN